MENSIPNQVAEQLKAQQEAEAARSRQTQQLYTMKCFEALFDSKGFPLVTRVPGGWIWYARSGGGGLQVITGEGTQEDPTQQVVGQMNAIISPVFVPYNSEFMLDGNGLGNLDS